MSRTILLAALLAACGPDSWSGVSANRHCTEIDGYGGATCVAGGAVYHCVRVGGNNVINRGGDMVCAEAAVKTTCTRILDVETRCPK